MKLKYITLLIFIVLPLLFVIIFLIKYRFDSQELAQSYKVQNEASQNLKEGMLYEDIQKYVQNAWRSYHCPPGENTVSEFQSREDVYVFGSRNLRNAANIYVRSELIDGKLIVTQIAHAAAEDRAGDGYTGFYPGCAIITKD